MHPVLLQSGLGGQGRGQEERSVPGILPGLQTSSSWVALELGKQVGELTPFTTREARHKVSTRSFHKSASVAAAPETVAKCYKIRS